MKKIKTILAIETSCDETGIALVEAKGGFASPKFRVLKNLVSSQIKIHRPFGGVVPGLAKREHIKNLPKLFRKILVNSKSGIRNPKQISNFKFQISNIDLIAVTVGPGLEPALWTGITFAQELRKRLATRDQRQEKKIKIIGVNHLEGHLYSFLLRQQKKTANQKSEIRNQKRKNLGFHASNLRFPAIVLLVSGGHTALLLMKNLRKWKKLGETRDDAAGEAFDKVARMLGLPYPGGPEIEKLAKEGDADAINFPRPMLNQKNYDFSFSGIKTAVFYYLRDRISYENTKTYESTKTKNKFRNFAPFRTFVSKADIAASFQKAVVETLVKKVERAAKEYGACSLILCGGVAANKVLRENMRKAAHKINAEFIAPPMEYNNDNAAMIAAAGYFASLRSRKLPLKADGDLNI